MKALKRAVVAVLSAVMGCCFFVGCLSTKMEVTYVVDGEVYRVQEYDMDTQVALPTPPTKEGHVFIGWYTDEACTNPYTEGKINQGITLYAKFSVSTVYIVINPNGGTVDNRMVEVVPGSDYTISEPTKEGYKFIGYTYIDGNGDEQPFPLTGKYPSSANIAITAQYEINKYTVTFIDSGAETEVSVNHGSVATSQAAEKAGYNFNGWYTAEVGGEKFDFTTAITADVTLYAQYSPKTFTITVNGAQEGYENPQVVYGEAYTLPTPDRGDAYEFAGFKKDGEAFEATGTYTWTEDIVVDATWITDKREIQFYDGNTELGALRIVSDYATDIATLKLPNVPAKTGYSAENVWYTDAACTQVFEEVGSLTDDIKLYAKYTANTYTVIFSVWDNSLKAMKPVTVTATYGQPLTGLAPDQAARESYNFDGYYYNGELFDLNAAYTYLEGITIEEKWSAKGDAVVWEDHADQLYFKERPTIDDAWTFVYLAGADYTFAAGTTLEVVGTGATASGNVLNVKSAGTFTLKVNGEARAVKVVEYVRSFTLGGTNYDAAWGLNAEQTDYKRNATDVWNKKVSIDAGEVMKVGATNFIPELNINGGSLSIDKANVEIKVVCDGADVPASLYTVNGGAINFDASLVGKTVSVTIEPRYAVDATHAVQYNVVLNNGYNVYTDADMKAAMGNTSITEINVLRNISVALDADDYVPGTSAPINGHSDTDTGSGVYERLAGNLQINGNYFTVDGSNLPLVDHRYDGRGFIDNGSAYILMNVQFSIFNFGTRGANNYDAVTMDNLNIIGNVDRLDDPMAYTNYQINNKPVLKNSGACMGIQVGSGTLNLNNVTSRYGAFAANAYAADPMIKQDGSGYTHRTKIVATDCNFANSWSNNIYVWGFGSVTLDSCYIGASNGAAVHFDARPSATGLNAAFNMSDDTKVENWVIGTESWFQAYNAVASVGQIKTQVETVVGALGGLVGASRTVTSGETVNFVFLMKQTGDAEEWITDPEGRGSVDMNIGYLDVVTAGTLLTKAQAGVITPEEYAQLQGIAPTVMTNYAKFAAAGAIAGIAYLEGFVEIINK